MTANTLRVLLIDADPREAEWISSRLSSANHSVIATSHLDEASEVLEIQRFDAVLLGAPIATGNAGTFAAKLRELDQRQRTPAHTPILSLSRQPEGSGDFRPDGYLPPSFEPDLLVETVANLARAVSSPLRQSPAGGEVPVFDPEKLRAQAGGDRELVAEIVGLFLSDYGNQVAEIRDALHDGDYARLSYVAHTIKGSLGTLGATLCWSRAQELESAAKRQDEQYCRELFPLFEDGIRTLVPHLQSLCEGSGKN